MQPYNFGRNRSFFKRSSVIGKETITIKAAASDRTLTHQRITVASRFDPRRPLQENFPLSLTLPEEKINTWMSWGKKKKKSFLV